MATYVSQATYNAGTPAQRATWTIDPGIISPNETPQQTVYVAPTPQQQTYIAPPPQQYQYTTIAPGSVPYTPSPIRPQTYIPPQQPSLPPLTYSEKQQLLMSQGMAYGNPDAPEYQKLYQMARPQTTQPSELPQQNYQYTIIEQPEDYYVRKQPSYAKTVTESQYTPENIIFSTNEVGIFREGTEVKVIPYRENLTVQMGETVEAEGGYNVPKEINVFGGGYSLRVNPFEGSYLQEKSPSYVEQEGQDYFYSRAGQAEVKKQTTKLESEGFSGILAVPIFNRETGETSINFTGSKTETITRPRERDATEYAAGSFQANIANSVMDVGASVERADYLGGFGEFIGGNIKSIDANALTATFMLVPPLAPLSLLTQRNENRNEEGLNYVTARMGNVVEGTFKTPSMAVKTGAAGVGVLAIGGYELFNGQTSATMARQKQVRQQEVQTFTNPNTYVEAGLAVAAFSAIGAKAKTTVPKTFDYATQKGWLKSEQIIKVDLEPSAPGSSFKAPVSSINQADIIARAGGQDIIGVKPASVYKFTPGTRYTIFGKAVDIFGDSSAQFTGAENLNDYALSGTAYKKGASGYPLTKGANIEEIQFAGSETPKQSIGKLEGTVQQSAYQRFTIAPDTINLVASQKGYSGIMPGMAEPIQPINFKAPKVSGYTKATPIDYTANKYQPFEMPGKATFRVSYPSSSVRIGIDVSPSYEGIGSPSTIKPFEPFDINPLSKNALAKRYVAEPSKPGQPLIEGAPARASFSDVRVASESGGHITTAEFQVETLARGKMGTTGEFEYFQFRPGETQVIFPGGKPGIIKMGQNVRGFSFTPETQPFGGGGGEITTITPPKTRMPTGKAPTFDMGGVINQVSGSQAQIQMPSMQTLGATATTDIGKAGAARDIMGGVINQVSGSQAQIQMPSMQTLGATATKTAGISIGRQSMPEKQVSMAGMQRQSSGTVMEQIFSQRPSTKFAYEPMEQISITKPTSKTYSESVKPQEFVKPSSVTKPFEVTKPIGITKPYGITKPFEITKPVGTTKPFDITKPFEVTKPTQITKPTEVTKPVEITRQIEITRPFVPPKNPPYTPPDVPPYVPPVIPPFIPFGGGGGNWGGYREGRGMSMKKGYSADLFSSTFNFAVKGKAPSMVSGLGIRPIYIQEAPKGRASAKSLKYRTPKFKTPKFKIPKYGGKK